MFATQHDNPPSLRQGDIIANVFFPLARPGSLRYLGLYRSGSNTEIQLDPLIEKPQGSTKQYVQSIAHGLVSYGAVISQCCDLDKKHPKNSFSLCRLIAFERTRFRSANTLTNNIDPWGPENPYFEFFYFGEIDGLPGEYIADFGLLTSLSWADYDLILGKKAHQLDDLNRNKFRVKVGAFFGRPTEEDRISGLANPYEPTTPLRRSYLDRIQAFFRS